MGTLKAMNLPEIPTAVTPLAYRGDPWPLCRLEQRAWLLGLLTLGTFWVRAKVRLRSYMWGQIYVGETPLRWAATAQDQARMAAPTSKFLLAAFAVSRIAGLLMLLRILQGNLWAAGSLDSPQSLLALLAYPMFLFASNQFELQHTELRNLRFGQDGSLWGYTRLYLLGLGWTVLTLGWGYAWFCVSTKKYLLEHSRYGDLRCRYTGEVRAIRPTYLWGSLAVLLTLGAYLPWHIARLRNYHANQVHLGPIRLRCHQEGSSLSNLWAGNGLIVLATLYLGYGWARTRSLRYQMQHLELVGDLNALVVRPGPDEAADGLPDLLGMGTCSLFGA